MIFLILLTLIIPLSVSILLNAVKFKNTKIEKLLTVTPPVLLLILNVIIAFLHSSDKYILLKISEDLIVNFKVDVISCFFSILISFIFLLVSIYSLEYFKEDERKNKFQFWYLLSLGALMSLCYSGNLVTMYISFEFVTLSSMPLVFHDKTKESIDAAMKYLIYSVSGAFLGLIGIIYLSLNTTTTDFVLYGSLNSNVNTTVLLIVLLVMVIGFGAKAGMFPLHNWLPAAHPVAPAPASAILSGIIAKSGIIAIIRIIYYVVGPDILRNTWFQYTWIGLILLTVLLGSFMALIQKNFKKRLAFSSISQISYALLGIAMLDVDGLTGTILQVSSHAIIKVCLFLTAGVLIHCLNKHYVDEVDGAGKQMPIIMWCYTICSLGLIGIPPTSGFVAKWYLCIGSIDSGLKVLYLVAPICLIISAILTAAYLLPVSIKAFLPLDKEKKYERIKEPIKFVVPLIILAVCCIGVGIGANPIIELIAGIF